LFDEHDRRIDGANKRGRIFIRSAARFEGYTDGPNKQIIDGYMSSGDMGHFDENGLLFVDGRDDDMIVSGGENVFPQEVENLLVEREDVSTRPWSESTTLTSESGCAPSLFSSPARSRTPSRSSFTSRTTWPGTRCHATWCFIDELPRNATGKLLRRVLVEMDVVDS